jgi:Resolvase, N terminal domain
LNNELDLVCESSSIADSDSTTGDSCGIDSKCMTKAALYARVSTDGQQKEGTIESQLAELRRQVAAAGHKLVKEYIDDGYSGTLLYRPGLDQLRADAKSDVYDAIHFLDADRITRDVSYQRIIIAELLKHGKQRCTAVRFVLHVPGGDRNERHCSDYSKLPHSGAAGWAIFTPASFRGQPRVFRSSNQRSP